MRVLAFRHVPFEGLGWIEAVLAARGIAADYADLYQPGAPLRDTKAYAGLISLGGPMSVNDHLDWLRREEQILREAVARGQPVLGICLGSQLIAKALGARVRRNPQKEIGWFPVRFTAAAQAKGIFTGLSAETIFHWHGETFDLPEGAELLASSDLCRHQAFRIGERVYGLQFHLEVTPAMISDWCLQDENCGDIRELNAILDPHYDAHHLQALAMAVFERWCDILNR